MTLRYVSSTFWRFHGKILRTGWDIHVKSRRRRYRECGTRDFMRRSAAAPDPLPLTPLQDMIGHIIVSTLIADGETANTGWEKAEMLNRQFCSVFTREDTSSCPRMPLSPYPDMPAINISSHSVKKILQNLGGARALCKVGPTKSCC